MEKSYFSPFQSSLIGSFPQFVTAFKFVYSFFDAGISGRQEGRTRNNKPKMVRSQIRMETKKKRICCLYPRN